MSVATVARREKDGATLSRALLVTLPGVHSWERPRPIKGVPRYSAKYQEVRERWALAVRLACYDQSWTHEHEHRYAVDMVAQGSGKRDLDRVINAVMDALTNGGVFRDDCLVDRLVAVRSGLPPDGLPVTTVVVTVLSSC